MRLKQTKLFYTWSRKTKDYMTEQPLSLLFSIFIHPTLQKVMWSRQFEKPEETCLSLAILVCWQIIGTIFFLPLQTPADQFNFILLYFKRAPVSSFCSSTWTQIHTVYLPQWWCSNHPLHLFLDGLFLAYKYAWIFLTEKSVSALPSLQKP